MHGIWPKKPGETTAQAKSVRHHNSCLLEELHLNERTVDGQSLVGPVHESPRASVSSLASYLSSLYPRFLYGTPRSRCPDYRLRPWNWPGHCSTFCKRRRRCVSYGAHGKRTQRDSGRDFQQGWARGLCDGRPDVGDSLRACCRRMPRKVRPDRYPRKQCRALWPGGSRGRLSAGGIRQSHCRTPSRGVSLVETRSAGDVRAAVRRDPEHLQPVGEVGLRVGLRLRRREGGHAGADASHSGGRSAEGRPRECHLPRTGDGNANVQGSWRRAREENGRERKGTIGRFSERFATGPRADGGGNRASSTLSLLRAIQRHDGTIHQRGWGRRVLLKDFAISAKDYVEPRAGWP